MFARFFLFNLFLSIFIKTSFGSDHVIVNLYTTDRNKGINPALEVKGCTVIPKTLRRKVSVVHLKSDACIKLHEYWNCSGLSFQINKTDQIRLNEGLVDFDEKAAAISTCNYTSIEPNNQSNSINIYIQPSQNVVTLFSEPGFKGNYTHLNLSMGCVHLNDDWESIQTYGLCIKVYESDRCNRSSTYFRIVQPERDLYSWNFDNGVRSIVSCEFALKYIEVNVPDEIDEGQNVVTVYTKPYFKGSSVETFNVTKCISHLPKPFDSSISSIKVKTNRQCVNLYNESRCKGNYIIVRSDTDSMLVKNKDKSSNPFVVRSIGPCHERCHPNNIDDNIRINGSANLTMFRKNGNKKLETLHEQGCIEMSKNLKKDLLSSYKEKHCIEVYEKPNCTGSSRQIRKEIINYSVKDSPISKFVQKAESLSLCGFLCHLEKQKRDALPSDNSTLNENNGTQFITPNQEYVIIFPQPNFIDTHGYKELNLHQGCLNIDEKWHNIIESIHTPGKCVYIYEMVDCSGYGKYFQLKDSTNLCDSNDSSFPIRSIQFCPSLIENSFFILCLVIIMILVLVILITLAFIIKRWKKNRKFFNQTAIELLNDDDDPLEIPVEKSYELSKDYIKIDKNAIFGSGKFSIVYKGKVKDPNLGKEYEIDVAVKTLKPEIDVNADGYDYLKVMLKEVKGMVQVGKYHSILELVGYCTQNLDQGEFLTVTEPCINGPLDKFLQAYHKSFNDVENNCNANSDQHSLIDTSSLCNAQLNSLTIDSGNVCPLGKQFNNTQLVKWSLEIAEGMEYLASKKLLHGDLSAKNVLLNYKFATKIRGFGISKRKYAFTQSVKEAQGPSSWRNMSIETLRDLEFSIESDTWAFGVTLWEIFSLGDVPYVGKEWGLSFLTELSNGLRLPKPKYASEFVYDLMLKCWDETPSQRKSFSELKAEFQKMQRA